MSVRDDIDSGKYDLEAHPNYQPPLEGKDKARTDKTFIERNRARRRANMELQGELMQQFQAAVFAELGLTTHPKREQAWSIARRHGIYVEIFDCMEELSELMI